MSFTASTICSGPLNLCHTPSVALGEVCVCVWLSELGIFIFAVCLMLLIQNINQISNTLHVSALVKNRYFRGSQ